MPEYSFRLTAIFQTFENDTHLAEALFFPEVSRFGANLKKLEAALQENAANLVETAPALTLYRRHATGEVELGKAQVVIQPPPKSLAWRNAVELSFDVLQFLHGDDAAIAYIPALGIEVIAKNLQDLAQAIPAQIHAHLLRLKQTTSLGALMWYERIEKLTLVSSTYEATLRTPKQLVRSLEVASEEKPILNDVATDLTKEKLPPAYELDANVQRLADVLAGRNPRSVLLIGKSGVGKTAAVYELVRRRQGFRLGRTPFYATSGSRLVAGMSGFGMWEERCGKVWREAAKQQAILHFGNLLELMEVGKSAAHEQGIASFFRPYIRRGDLLCIVECTPEQLPIIEREDPHLAEAFFHIKVAEPTLEQGRTILLNYAVAAGKKGNTPIDYDGLEMLDRLHRRYASYSAYPGRPLRFLKNLLQDRQDEIISAGKVTERFAAETGLPLFLLDDAVALDLPTTQAWFGERVIGQPEAVNLVVDLLATVKARLTRAGKPIASLMFIGPTGVGKTEMAKSLAEFLFRNRHRMIRFDMSEYADELAVSRLIGGEWGKEGLLTAKVREQPFAVILLDEFEKAHTAFFDLLLQVLGEGRLTDSVGRVADFTNAVVIMTSNLGAETYKQSALGFREAASMSEKARDHFMKAVRAFVRPEFFNRLDRIIPFAPLDEATVLQIAHRELAKVTRRDGLLYRGVEVQLSDDVARYLARRGYDARYGARPLKRAIERELLVPLADGLNRQPAEVSLRADVKVGDDKLAVEVSIKTDEAGRMISYAAKGAPFAELAKQVAALRRDAQNLNMNAAAVEIRNEIFTLERLAKRLARKKWQDAEPTTALARLPELKRQIQKLEEIVERVSTLEDAVLLCFYGKQEIEKEALQARLIELSRAWDAVLLQVYGSQFRQPDDVTLAVFGENTAWLFELARAYYELAAETNTGIEVCEFVTPTSEESEAIKARIKGGEKLMVYVLFDRVTVKRPVERVKEFLQTPRSTTLGIAVRLQGELVFPRYEPERGLHSLRKDTQTHKNLVHTSDVPLADFAPPNGLEKRGSINHQERRRDYNRNDGTVEDLALKEKFFMYRDEFKLALRQAIEKRLSNDAKALLEEA
ncbi:MAG: ATP-dependent Clp protease ATP-binding subunit [Acidobacteria bacterium]|nr:ATP-dependent Clp protease ATP-binding subunit [Acidobacteriota bacterium]